MRTRRGAPSGRCNPGRRVVTTARSGCPTRVGFRLQAIPRPDLSCEYLSPSWHEYTGITPAQALEEGWSRGVHPEDLARWLDCCVRAFDAREPFEIEYRLRRRDGEYRWFLDRGVPRYSPQGEFAGYAGVCVEIEAHKQAQAELARAGPHPFRPAGSLARGLRPAAAAACAAQALETLADWRPDVLLAEPGMRDADGCSLIRVLRSLPATVARLACADGQ